MKIVQNILIVILAATAVAGSSSISAASTTSSFAPSTGYVKAAAAKVVASAVLMKKQEQRGRTLQEATPECFLDPHYEYWFPPTDHCYEVTTKMNEKLLESGSFCDDFVQSVVPMIYYQASPQYEGETTEYCATIEDFLCEPLEAGNCYQDCIEHSQVFFDCFFGQWCPGLGCRIFRNYTTPAPETDVEEPKGVTVPVALPGLPVHPIKGSGDDIMPTFDSGSFDTRSLENAGASCDPSFLTSCVLEHCPNAVCEEANYDDFFGPNTDTTDCVALEQEGCKLGAQVGTDTEMCCPQCAGITYDYFICVLTSVYSLVCPDHNPSCSGEFAWSPNSGGTAAGRGRILLEHTTIVAAAVGLLILVLG